MLTFHPFARLGLRTKARQVVQLITSVTGEAVDSNSLWSGRAVKKVVKAGIVTVDGAVCKITGQTVVPGGQAGTLRVTSTLQN